MNMDDMRGMKRLGEEVGGNLEIKKVRVGEVDGILETLNEVRVLQEVESDMPGLGNFLSDNHFLGFEETGFAKGFDGGFRNAGDMAGDLIRGETINNQVVAVGEDNMHRGKKVSYSGLQPVNSNNGDGIEIGLEQYNQLMAETREEVIDISSDDSDEEVIVVAEVKGKGKQVEQINSYENFGNFSDGWEGMEMDLLQVQNINSFETFDLGFGGMEMDRSQAGEINSFENFGNFNLGIGGMEMPMDTLGDGNSGSGAWRYSMEEKGKAKVGDPWLSIASEPFQMDVLPEEQEFGIQYNTSSSSIPFQFETIELEQTDDLFLTADLGLRLEQVAAYEDQVMPQFELPFIEQQINQVPANNLEFGREWAAGNAAQAVDALQQRADTVRHRTVSSQVAQHYARFNSQEADTGLKQKSPSIEIDEQLGNTPGPFSTALKIIREQNLKKNAHPLIGWKPSRNADFNGSAGPAPSLLDLSLKFLVQNAEALVSLEGVPDTLRKRLMDLLCDSRRMNIRMLNLLLKGSPTEIRIKDCSWLTEDGFSKSFRDLDGCNLMVLQLDMCGQGLLDPVLGETIARSSHGLPNLGILSLRGACRLSDSALTSLVASAPLLQSINLGQCSLLTHSCIEIISNSLGGLLKELHINECHSIDAMCTIPALKKLKCLEVLSVAGIQTVGDQFVCEIVKECGKNLKELDLADCEKLTDYSMKVIGDGCANLLSLNISNLQRLTDVGIQFLANGCRSIQRLNLQRNGFSDDALAAYLEASGQCLEELSLNHCSKVDQNTALSLAKFSRALVCLDLSWCRRISDEALGLILDSCPLKLVKLFGCTQITSVSVNGHSNSTVQIVGLRGTLILHNINKFEPEEVFLRYSPLLTSSGI
nr:F-box protein [Ipomoea batatas]